MTELNKYSMNMLIGLCVSTLKKVHTSLHHHQPIMPKLSINSQILLCHHAMKLCNTDICLCFVQKINGNYFAKSTTNNELN